MTTTERAATRGTLTTVDCVAQSLAVGPIFSAAALGAILAGLAGGVGPLVVLMTLVGILGIGYTISQLARRYSGAGTVYEFIAHTVGRRWAIGSAGLYHLAVIALAGPGISIVAGIQAKGFLADHLGVDLPWWVCSLGVAAIVTGLNVVGVHVSMKAQLGIIIASIIPFLIVAAVIVAKGGSSGNTLDPFRPGSVAAGGSLFNGVLFAILMFVGFELAAALGEETADPQRSIPRAVLATILIVAAFYLITQYVGTIGSGGADNLPFDFAVLADHYVGGWMKVLIELGILLDMFAVGIGFTAAGARGLFTLARDGLLPAPLAARNRASVPANAQFLIGVVSVAAVVVALAHYGTGPVFDEGGAVVLPEQSFNAFLVLTTFGGMIVSAIYGMVCLGGLVYFVRRRAIPGIVAAVIGAITAVGGVAAQFLPDTAPVGDALWGRHAAIGAVVIVGVWLLIASLTRPQAVELAGAHTMHHEE